MRVALCIAFLLFCTVGGTVGRILLQSGNEFPSGLILGANATCESGVDDGTLRYVNSTVQICVAGSGWTNVGDVGGVIVDLQNRVSELEDLISGEGSSNFSASDSVRLQRIDSFTFASSKIARREACNFHGTYDPDTDECVCDCSMTRGCWDPEERCSTCLSGYEGEKCRTDVLECSLNTHTCNANSDCVDTFGSFECACHAGYTNNPSNALECIDIDECSTGSHDCVGNAFCVNSEGSYHCACPTGYSLLPNGVNCTDALCGGAPEEAAYSCLQILQDCVASPLTSGLYWLNVDGDIVHTYCDMESIGGGWTTCMSVATNENYGSAVDNIPDGGDWRSDIFSTGRGQAYTLTVPSTLSVGWVNDSAGGAIGCDRIASRFPNSKFEMMFVVPYRSSSGSGSVSGYRGVVVDLPNDWETNSAIWATGKYYMKSTTSVQWNPKLGGTDYACMNRYADGQGRIYHYTSGDCSQSWGTDIAGMKWGINLMGTNIEDGAGSCSFSNSFNTCGSNLIDQQTRWTGEGDEFCTSHCHGAGFHTGSVGVGMDILIRESYRHYCGSDPEYPASSCKYIRDSCSHTGSGMYWIWTRSGATSVYCDMDLEDGGWTTCLGVTTTEALSNAVNNIPNGGDFRTDLYTSTPGVTHTLGLPTSLKPSYMDDGSFGGSIGCAFDTEATEVLMIAHFVQGGSVVRYKGVRATLPSDWATTTDISVASTRYLKSATLSDWQTPGGSSDYFCFNRQSLFYMQGSTACSKTPTSPYTGYGSAWALHMMGSNIEDGGSACQANNMYDTCGIGIIDHQTVWQNEGDELCTGSCYGSGWGAASAFQPAGISVLVR